MTLKATFNLRVFKDKTILWYIDDPKNRIESSAYSSREVIEGEYTVKVVSTLNGLTLDRTK